MHTEKKKQGEKRKKRDGRENRDKNGKREKREKQLKACVKHARAEARVSLAQVLAEALKRNKTDSSVPLLRRRRRIMDMEDRAVLDCAGLCWTVLYRAGPCWTESVPVLNRADMLILESP